MCVCVRLDYCALYNVCAVCVYIYIYTRIYCSHPFDVIGSICASNDAIILILYVHVYGGFYYYIE